MRASFLMLWHLFSKQFCVFVNVSHLFTVTSIHDVDYIFTLAGIYLKVCAQLFLLVVLDSITAITCLFLNWLSE